MTSVWNAAHLISIFSVSPTVNEPLVCSSVGTQVIIFSPREISLFDFFRLMIFSNAQTSAEHAQQSASEAR